MRRARSLAGLLAATALTAGTMGLAAGCAGGEEPVKAVISAELDAQYAALRQGTAEAVLKAPQGIDWDTVYVFPTDTSDKTITEVVGDPVEWQEQNVTRSSSELMVFVLKGEAVGAYEIAWGLSSAQYRHPFHREVRLSIEGAEKSVQLTGQ
ncbi:hypothetical protein ACWEQL_31730 [Kitasatospora sp. NPDC004240]